MDKQNSSHIKTYRHKYLYSLNYFLGSLAERYQRFSVGRIRLAEYRDFLEDIEAYKPTNEIYLHVARLSKPSFFVLHHDVHSNARRMMELARLEHSLGWRSTYFVRPGTDCMTKEIAKELWDMKHDLGLLYDCLETTIGDKIGHNEQDIKGSAWMKFKNILNDHLELNITCTAAYNRPLGVDNTLLWRDHNYRTMHIRCDAEMDLRNQDIVYFRVSGDRVEYLMRQKDGGYRELKPGLRIENVQDLGRRLKAGNMVDRMIVRLEWR
jgi:hypothetical protein